MTNSANNQEKRYNLEERTLQFFKETIRLCKTLSQNVVNTEIVRQLIRAVGSTGANYREANEAISKKDLAFRIKICRKEAKEAHFWFCALQEANPEQAEAIEKLAGEALELTMIFSSIKNKVL